MIRAHQVPVAVFCSKIWIQGWLCLNLKLGVGMVNTSEARGEVLPCHVCAHRKNKQEISLKSLL